MDTTMKPTIYFLNLDIGKSLTGVEASALARAKMMHEQLGLDPVFVTSYYKPELYNNVKLALDAGRAYPNMPVLSMYDYFQDAVDYIGNPDGKQFEVTQGFSAALVNEQEANLRVYQKGIQVGYVARDPQTKAITFQNHLHNEKVWRRDWYDCRGFLSKIEFIDTTNYTMDAYYEHYLRPDGTLAMVRLYQFEEKDSKKMRSHRVTQVINRDGMVTHQFNSEEEMLTAFYQAIASDHSVFIVERMQEFYAAAKAAKINNPALKIVPIFHSTHYTNWTDKAGDPFTSSTSQFHKIGLDNLTYSDANIVFTPQQKTHIEARFGQGNIHVIPHSHDAIHHTDFSQRDRKKLVMLGRFAEEKQHWLAVEAFAQVVKKHKEATLTIYGYDGGKEALIKETIAKHKLEKHVKLMPFEHDVQSIYRKAGMMLMSSRNEGFGLVIMESLFNGCPVVSFDCNYGPAAMIQHDVNGKLVPAQDVNAFAQAINAILDDASFHQRLVEQASDSMQAFTHESVAKQWKALLESL
jgi:poly(glycerol-phosphate) alpha-glucosyltransferase